jgi:hypothetical protein
MKDPGICLAALRRDGQALKYVKNKEAENGK